MPDNKKAGANKNAGTNPNTNSNKKKSADSAEKEEKKQQAADIVKQLYKRNLTLQDLRTEAHDTDAVTTIAIEPEIRTPKGNFGFLYAATAQKRLYQECVLAEAYARTDISSANTHIRRAFEELSFYTFGKAICTVRPEMTLPEATQFARDVYNLEKQLYTPKLQICIVLTALGYLYTGKTTDDFGKLHTFYKGNYACPAGKDVCDLVFALYNDSSSFVHSGKEGAYQNILDILKKFYLLTGIFFQLNKSCGKLTETVLDEFTGHYRESLMPLEKYFPLSKECRRKMGLQVPQGSIFCLTEEEPPAYYLLKRVTKAPEVRRDIESLHQLWSAAQKTPENVLLDIGTLDSEEVQYHLFRIMGRPYSLTEELLDTLTSAQKRQLVQGITAGIYTLHHFEPPMPHRALRPSCYYMYKSGRNCHAVLSVFSTIKNEAGGKTVYRALDTVLQNAKESVFLAPELSRQADTATLKKADLYSLGRLIAYIYTGKPEVDADDMTIPYAMLHLVQQLTDPDPNRRPDIDRVYTLLQTGKKPRIAYGAAACCGTRPRQEDILLADGTIQSEPEYSIGETAVQPAIFAVLDGLGGAIGGAETAHTAAEAIDQTAAPYLAMDLTDYTAPLQRIFEQTECRTKQYMLSHGFTRSGAAAAAVIISYKAAYVANLGDCRVYLLSNGTLTQVSRDHCAAIANRHELYQFFGVSDEDTEIDPYIGRLEYKTGDRLLLCTDGVTNCLNDAELRKILTETPQADAAATAILAAVNKAGARDNATALVLNLL